MNSNLYENLIANLMYLRKDKGFTAGRLRIARTLLGILGGSNQDFVDLKTRFVSAINSLPDKTAANLLLAAYALTPKYADITPLALRRKVFGQAIGLKPDAIAKHENAAINELAILLLTARYTMSPLPFSSNVIPHNAALQEYVEVSTVVKDRLWQTTKDVHKIISLVDEIGWLEISTDIPAKVISTCAASVETQTNSNGRVHSFYFDKPIKRGQDTLLSYVSLPDEELASQADLVLIEETRSFHEPALAAKFSITFFGEQPSIIWQYDHLTAYERPGKPTREGLIEVVGFDDGDNLNDCYEAEDIEFESGLADGDGYFGGTATANFTDLYGGMFSGVAWRW